MTKNYDIRELVNIGRLAQRMSWHAIANTVVALLAWFKYFKHEAIVCEYILEEHDGVPDAQIDMVDSGNPSNYRWNEYYHFVRFEGISIPAPLLCKEIVGKAFLSAHDGARISSRGAEERGFSKRLWNPLDVPETNEQRRLACWAQLHSMFERWQLERCLLYALRAPNTAEVVDAPAPHALFCVWCGDAAGELEMHWHHRGHFCQAFPDTYVPFTVDWDLVWVDDLGKAPLPERSPRLRVLADPKYGFILVVYESENGRTVEPVRAYVRKDLGEDIRPRILMAILQLSSRRRDLPLVEI